MAVTRIDLSVWVSQLKFRDWEFLLRFDGNRPYLQLQFSAKDSVTGEENVQWRSRKWWLSYHMTKTEVVRTAWKAVKGAVEHEAAEDFTFKGAQVFNPHMDIEALVAAAAHVEKRASVEIEQEREKFVFT